MLLKPLYPVMHMPKTLLKITLQLLYQNNPKAISTPLKYSQMKTAACCLIYNLLMQQLLLNRERYLLLETRTLHSSLLQEKRSLKHNMFHLNQPPTKSTI